MNNILSTILIASFGAALQELVSWYNLRNTLDAETQQKLMKSKAYWVITGLMIVGAGVGTWVWFNGEKHQFREYFLTGAAFPLLIKKGLSAISNGETTKLGDESKSSIQEYFRVN